MMILTPAIITPLSLISTELFTITVIYTVCGAINNRFNQEELGVYASLKGVILHGIKSLDVKPYVSKIANVYGDDFDQPLLLSKLLFLPKLVNNMEVKTVAEFAAWLKASPKRKLLGEIEKIVTSLLALPATNAVSERSFSVLRRVKTYLRSTMTQQRLNHLMLLHVHKDLTDALNAQSIISEYVSGHTGRSHKIATIDK